MQVIVLKSNDGHEAVYINGALHDTGEPLGEGYSQLYFLRLHEFLRDNYNYILRADDIHFEHLSDVDNSEMDDWYPNITDFCNSYEPV